MARARQLLPAVAALVAALAAGSCNRDQGGAPLDDLALPTGLALSPEGHWLFVSNGNWDRSYSGSSVVALDLVVLEAGLEQPAPAGEALDGGQPCREHPEDRERLECDARLVAAGELGVRVPSGAGNIAVHRPEGEGGAMRLLIPTRIDAGLSWIDVLGPGFGDDEGLRFDCGQDDRRHCAARHRVEGIPGDPARVSVDALGFPYAYLPQLLGEDLTLISLDGEQGPEVVDVQGSFFREDELFDTGFAGGFAVAQRACDPDSDNVPAPSNDCARPYLFATNRWWWGLRTFRVAPGLDVVVTGGEHTILGPNLEDAEPRPLMAGLVFEDPEQGDRLLVVHTTPPALTRVDTSLNSNDIPRIEELESLSLCSNPNVIVVHDPADTGASGPKLALISCYGDDEVAVVDLAVFALIATIPVGDGPNELLLDPRRQWLVVANTAESTLSLVELDITSPRYLEEFATVGLGSPSRSAQAAPQ